MGHDYAPKTNQSLENANFVETNDKKDFDSCNFALRLGYAVTRYSSELEQSIALANFGIVYASLTTECSGEYTAETRQAWTEFLKFKQCLSCQNHCETRFKRPYCKSCWYQIHNDSTEEDIVVNELDDKELSELRKVFSFLNDVPGGWKLGDECSSCHKNSENVQQYVYWMHKKRNICLSCVQEIVSGQRSKPERLKTGLSFLINLTG